MGSIKPIESRSIHQIQSGQVIVDLCSVVKELVENSLDAGASSIDVRFKNHGLDAIEVQDNGRGIAQYDYENIALKHYTSKLNSYDDLGSLTTFGFRGEALSSLCALSKFHIITAQDHEAPKGKRLDFEISGKLKEVSIVACKQGTSVVTEELFSNLPVRRKELEKNIKREYGKVLNVLHSYACISTKIRFTVSNQTVKSKKAIVFATNGNSLTKDNIANVFGAKALPALIALDLDFELQPTNYLASADRVSRKVKVIGHISKPISGEGRQTPDRQMFFVNSRPCGLPQIAKAFNEVYKTYNLTQSPFVFANLQMDTNSYDVNVSPDKRTILLHDQSALLESLKESLVKLFNAQEQTIPQSSVAFSQLSTLKSSRISKTNEDDREHGTRSNAGSTLGINQSTKQSGIAIGKGHINGESSYDELPITAPTPLMQKYVEQHFKDSNGTAVEERLDRSKRPKEKQGLIDRFTHQLAPVIMKGVRPLDKASDGNEQDMEVDEDDSESIVQENSVAESNEAELKFLRKSLREPNARSHKTNKRHSPVGNIEEVQQPKFRKASELHFARSLQSFTASSSQHPQALIEVESGEEEEEEEEEKEEEEERGEDEEEEEQLEEGEEGEEGEEDVEDRSNEKDNHSKALNSGASEGMPEEFREHDTDAFELPRKEVSEDGEYIEYIDEVERKKKDEERIQKIVRAAERKAARPSQENRKRAAEVLSKKAKRRNLTWNLGTSIKTSVTHIKSQLSILQHSMDSFEVKDSPPDRSGENGGSNESENKDQSKFDGQTPTSDTSIPSKTLDSTTSSKVTAEERLSLTISKSDFAQMRIVGQFNLGFILTTRSSCIDDASISPSNTGDKDNLFIIDQHASDEIYNFSRLSLTTALTPQPLVTPYPLELTAIEEETILSHSNTLSKNGFNVAIDTSGDSPVGQRCKLLTLPTSRETVFNTGDLEELVAMLSETSVTGGEVLRPSRVRRMLAMRACRSSIMVGKTLTKKGMRNVVNHMGEIERPWNCPHGRPTMRHLAGLANWKPWFEGDGLADSPREGESAATNWAEYLANADLNTHPQSQVNEVK